MSETTSKTQTAILELATQLGDVSDLVASLEKQANDSATPINAAKANIEAATVSLNAAVEGLNAPKVKALEAVLAEEKQKLADAISAQEALIKKNTECVWLLESAIAKNNKRLADKIEAGEAGTSALTAKVEAENAEFRRILGVIRDENAKQCETIRQEYHSGLTRTELQAAATKLNTDTLTALATRIDTIKLEAVNGINPRGPWDSAVTYNRGDLVALNGSSYVSLVDNNTERPGKKAKNWMVIALRYGGGGGSTESSGGGGGGSGTVTSVSVAAANGFTGTVANATTTPAITIIAGAITPTSVNSVVISGASTPTLAVTGTTAVSGTNTGDSTIAAAGTLTGTTLAANVVTSSLTSVGTIATGVWNGTDVAVADGGTGRSTGTTAYALVATGTTATGAQQTLASGATTEILVGGGASALPVWTTANGTGAPVRTTSAALVTPALGTPTSGVLTSCTIPWAESFACSDETTALTTGEKVSFRMPYAMTLTSIFCGVKTAPTGSSIVIDVEKAGNSLLSATAQIEVSEFDTSTSATPGVVSGGTQSLAIADLITIDVDQIGSTVAGAGLKVTLIGTKP